MTSLASYSLTTALAQALMHFVWQGALIGLAAFGLWRVRSFSSHTRYLIGIVALAAMLIAPLATTAYFAKTGPLAPVSASVGVPGGLVAGTDGVSVNALVSSKPAVEPFAPPSTRTLVILAIWIAGVIGLSLRLLGGWIVARRLATRAVQPISDELAAISQRIAERLAIDRVVSVFESSAISVPVMVGWLRPVVLIPTAVLAGLTPVQIEALLAHELAHVRRHDYLVNLLQAVVETLLFYHPAVWWVSSRVRAEREHCCDDLVVSVCDRLTYATALTDLAAMTTPRMALAATDGSLLDRVRRILGQPDDAGRAPSGWAPAVLMVLAVGALVPGAVGSPELNAEKAGLTVSAMQAPEQTVVSGVPGGVAAGVPGGVPSGVPGGIPSGVTAGVPVVDQQNDEEVRRRLLREYERLKAQYEEVQTKPTAEQEVQTQKILELLKADLATRESWLIRQRQLEEERAKLKYDQLDSEQVALQRELEIKIVALRKQMEDAKRRVEVGVVPKDVVEKMEAELQSALAQNESAQRNRALARQQFALESRDAQERVEFEVRQLQIEQAKQELMAKELGYQALLGKLRESGNLEARAQEERKAELMKQMERMTLELSTGAEESERQVDQNRDVRVGDLLRIEIQSEPGLQKGYEVAADGTIRIPFLGVVRVAGRTPAQIGEQLQRALIERKLAERAEVSVRIVR